MKKIIYILIIMFSFFSISCEKNEIEDLKPTKEYHISTYIYVHSAPYSSNVVKFEINGKNSYNWLPSNDVPDFNEHETNYDFGIITTEVGSAIDITVTGTNNVTGYVTVDGNDYPFHNSERFILY